MKILQGADGRGGGTYYAYDYVHDAEAARPGHPVHVNFLIVFLLREP